MQLDLRLHAFGTRTERPLKKGREELVAFFIDKGQAKQELLAIFSDLELPPKQIRVQAIEKPYSKTKAAQRFFLPFLLVLSLTPLEARMPTQVEGQTHRDYWQFVFLFESTQAAGQKEWFFHPFYSHYRNEEKAYDYYTSLYPLFYSHGTNYWKKWTLFYFFTGEDVYHEDTKEDSDLFLSPLFHIGSGDNPDENYYSFFPVWGKMKAKLSWDEINYVLFPLYVNWSGTDYKGRTYKAHSLLWPIIMWGSGQDRSDFRIFPLYSKKEHKGKYVRRSFLWPFFQWGSDALDKKDPRHSFLFFPVYGRKWSDSGSMQAHTFLWLPFLGGLFAYGEDTRRNALEFNALFFIYQYAHYEDPTIRKHIFFPFYGYYRFGAALNKEELAREKNEGVYFDKYKEKRKDSPFYKEAEFITPLYVHLRTNSVLVESDYHVLIPFYWDMERYHRPERSYDYYNKLWPLYSYISDDSGRREFRSLALWPLRSDQFDRSWGTFYSLLEYNVYENGDRYFSLLFRLYSRYWNKDEEHHFLLGLEYHKAPDYWSLEFLGGFLGYRHDVPSFRNDLTYPKSTWKLLWLDL